MINKIKLQVSILIIALSTFADKALAAWRNGQDLGNVPDLPWWATKIKWAFVNGADGSTNQIMIAIKNIINRWLGLLAFISIVILIRAGFKMLFNASDDGEQKKAFAVVKNVAIALIFIGISWLIVSGIFWFIGIVAA